MIFSVSDRFLLVCKSEDFRNKNEKATVELSVRLNKICFLWHFIDIIDIIDIIYFIQQQRTTFGGGLAIMPFTYIKIKNKHDFRTQHISFRTELLSHHFQHSL